MMCDHRWTTYEVPGDLIRSLRDFIALANSMKQQTDKLAQLSAQLVFRDDVED